ncbi:MAG: arsenate reductase family protein [Firmicutes bacterium]|nr:arsenate reductase family protein [Bacillota bacterium]
MQFICYPKCTTCQKARKWLEAEGCEFTERHIKEDNPSRQELEQWQEKSGLPLRRFFNTSGQLYRSLGLKDKLDTMSRDDQLELLSGDGMLVKRPLLIGEGCVLVGFKEDEWREALK